MLQDSRVCNNITIGDKTITVRVQHRIFKDAGTGKIRYAFQASINTKLNNANLAKDTNINFANGVWTNDSFIRAVTTTITYDNTAKSLNFKFTSTDGEKTFTEMTLSADTIIGDAAKSDFNSFIGKKVTNITHFMEKGHNVAKVEALYGSEEITNLYLKVGNNEVADINDASKWTLEEGWTADTSLSINLKNTVPESNKNSKKANFGINIPEGIDYEVSFETVLTNFHEEGRATFQVKIAGKTYTMRIARRWNGAAKTHLRFVEGNTEVVNFWTDKDINENKIRTTIKYVASTKKLTVEFFGVNINAVIKSGELSDCNGGFSNFCAYTEASNRKFNTTSFFADITGAEQAATSVEGVILRNFNVDYEAPATTTAAATTVAATTAAPAPTPTPTTGDAMLAVVALAVVAMAGTAIVSKKRR